MWAQLVYKINVKEKIKSALAINLLGMRVFSILINISSWRDNKGFVEIIIQWK